MLPPCPHLHTIGEHDAYRHELGENLQQLRVGQHTVLQAVVKETCVVAKDIVNVGGLQTKARDFTEDTGHVVFSSGLVFYCLYIAIVSMGLCSLKDYLFLSLLSLCVLSPLS